MTNLVCHFFIVPIAFVAVYLGITDEDVVSFALGSMILWFQGLIALRGEGS